MAETDHPHTAHPAKLGKLGRGGGNWATPGVAEDVIRLLFRGHRELPVGKEQAEMGTVTERVNFTLTVYRNEPLMWLIAKLRFTPITLGMAFFFFISLTLTVWADFITPQLPRPESSKYFSYFQNISWSIAILFLYPFVVGLTLKYYRAIPLLFEYLFNNIVGENTNHQDVKEFYQWLDKWFNFPLLSIAFIFMSLFLSAIYFVQIFENKELSWMTVISSERLEAQNEKLISSEALKASSEALKAQNEKMIDVLIVQKCREIGEVDFLESISRLFDCLSPIALFAAVIQIVLIYWVFHLVYRGAIFAWGLHEFFNRRNFNVNIEPLHPDGYCGLRPIGNTAMLLNMTFFALGIYVSLKVIDKIVMQGSSLGADISNPIMLGAYVIIVPLLFFLPLSSAHRKMTEAKIHFMLPVSQRCEVLFSQLSRQELDSQGMSAKTYSEMNKIRTEMKREIAVWPFDFRSIESFFGTIVVPVLPVVLAVIGLVTKYWAKLLG